MIKIEFIAACQRLDANLRHVSSTPPSTNNFNQSPSADMENKTPSRPDKSEGVASCVAVVVVVVPFGTVLFMLGLENFRSP